MTTDILYFNANHERWPLERKTRGASGYDLPANLSTPRTLEPGQRWKVPTGIALAMPLGVEAQVRGRSGLRLHHGIVVPTATIDSDFRGDELHAVLFNLSQQPFVINPGDRIAQLIFAPVLVLDDTIDARPTWGLDTGIFGLHQQMHIRRVDALDELPPSDRGKGGFGSTGQ